jgi:hypothetical protein
MMLIARLRASGGPSNLSCGSPVGQSDICECATGAVAIGGIVAQMLHPECIDYVIVRDNLRSVFTS